MALVFASKDRGIRLSMGAGIAEQQKCKQCKLFHFNVLLPMFGQK
jgi:hypothetical protein